MPNFQSCQSCALGCCLVRSYFTASPGSVSSALCVAVWRGIVVCSDGHLEAISLWLDLIDRFISLGSAQWDGSFQSIQCGGRTEVAILLPVTEHLFWISPLSLWCFWQFFNAITTLFIDFQFVLLLPWKSINNKQVLTEGFWYLVEHFSCILEMSFFSKRN